MEGKAIRTPTAHAAVRLALQGSLLLACAALGPGAFGQALTAEQRVLVNDNHGAAINPAFDRAFRTPLEIVWLRAAAEEEMWNSAALAQAIQRCGPQGKAKEGCAVLGRTAYRYVFGGNTPAADGAARLIVSSLNLPGSTFVSGRLNVVGTGRLYVITPPPEKPGTKPKSGAIVLAAGSQVQIVDAAQPAIQIELKAPDDEALLLGSLAGTDLGKVLSLLVGKAGTPSASEAALAGSGRVVLRGSGEVQFAMVGPKQDVPATMLAKAPATEPARATPTEQLLVAAIANLSLTPGAQRVESAGARSSASIPSGPHAGPALDVALAPLPVRVKAEQIALLQDFSPRAAAVAPDGQRVIPLAPVRDLAGALVEVALAPAPRVAPGNREIALAQDFSPGALSFSPSIQPAGRNTPIQDTRRTAEIQVAVLAPERPTVNAEKLALAAFTPEAPAAAQPAPAASGTAKIAEPIVIAAVTPVVQAPAKPAVASPKPAIDSDVARMRAEVEAEIRREQERLAQMLHARPAAKRAVFGT